jgi:hypothetical protein
MKWGMSLLDPSMRDVLGGLPSTDPAFAGVRPANHNDATNTRKYVVLMTDGQNASGPRIRPNYYTNAADRIAISATSVPTFASDKGLSLNSVRYWPTNAQMQDIWLLKMCDLAKQEMTVFTISMGAPEHGASVMEQCASQPSYAYKTNFTGEDGEPGIEEIFRTIAEQIKALRLSL